MNLKSRLLDWMGGGEGDFTELSLEVFRHQFAENTAYRNYCVALGKHPENISSWRGIPAVPTDAFKLPGVALRCFPESEVTGHFLTSGTTSETKGKHDFRDLGLYQASVRGAWQLLGLPEIRRPWFFSQRPGDAPHSSLVRMFGFLDDGGEWLIGSDGRIAVEKFYPNGPAAVLGTSLALLRVCAEMAPVELPEGSWIFETGGSKGLKKSFTPAEVRARLSAHFGVPESRILNEYGMTELFSQFYKWGDAQTHTGPPWTGIRVIDVHTGEAAAPGGIGYLEIIDLANLDTVSAIRTQDLAIAVGDREFVLIGRDPSAVARGCSRGVEDVLAGS
jgi:hypothetical protein